MSFRNLTTSICTSFAVYKTYAAISSHTSSNRVTHQISKASMYDVTDEFSVHVIRQDLVYMVMMRWKEEMVGTNDLFKPSQG